MDTDSDGEYTEEYDYVYEYVYEYDDSDGKHGMVYDPETSTWGVFNRVKKKVKKKVKQAKSTVKRTAKKAVDTVKKGKRKLTHKIEKKPITIVRAKKNISCVGELTYNTFARYYGDYLDMFINSGKNMIGKKTIDDETVTSTGIIRLNYMLMYLGENVSTKKKYIIPCPIQSIDTESKTSKTELTYEDIADNFMFRDEKSFAIAIERGMTETNIHYSDVPIEDGFIGKIPDYAAIILTNKKVKDDLEKHGTIKLPLITLNGKNTSIETIEYIIYVNNPSGAESINVDTKDSVVSITAEYTPRLKANRTIDAFLGMTV